ncbi:hypothetical protein [Phyllobacterium meliloti]|uniref:hypothetical protein n=1 Tax=Phyllobacterium meliloti TaxID=555317 RepID=UPI001D14874E|nr:hypothetical protein [Phyllobacterium sp. T1293]UGX87132.1 hypothetical protein LLE53_004605 [Phyllobacterium sp. T1293]
MTGRTLIGDFGGGDYRIRMSKSGKDVTTTLNPEDLAFDSAWLDSAVIIDRGVIAISSGGIVTISFSTTLDAVPFVIYWRQIDSNTFFMSQTATNSAAYQAYYATTSLTELKFWNSSVLPPITIGYIVLKGPIIG